MSGTVTALTIKNAPKGTMRIEKGLRYKSNGDGTGAWQGRYSINGREKAIALGKYPAVSLKDARDAMALQRAKVLEGTDPKAERMAQAKASDNQTTTFKKLAEMSRADIEGRWKDGGAKSRYWGQMTKHVFPSIGRLSAAQVTPRDLAAMVRPMWHSQHPIATKLLQHVSAVLAWGEASGYDCDSFAAKRARIILGKTRYRGGNVKSLSFDAVPDFYTTLGGSMQDLGLAFYILTIPRTANVARARWEQIEGNVWHLPPDEMKREDDHYVPLSAQALAILDRAAQFYDTREGYIFKNPSSWKTGHISTNNWTQKMRRGELDATAHGMRSSFKMWATMGRIDTDTIIEECLHHKARGDVEAAYMRGHTAELRRPIMQHWANFVTGENVAVEVKPPLSLVKSG